MFAHHLTFDHLCLLAPGKLKIFELEMGEDSGSLGGVGSLAESGGADGPDGSVSESRFSFLDGE